MNFKEQAIQIASAEDPYGEFEKAASELSSNHKTTLAREVNKQFFLSRLNGENENIAFDIIQPSASSSVSHTDIEQSVVEKTASVSQDTLPNKSHLVTSDMFSLGETVYRGKHSSSFGGASEHLEKIAEAQVDEIHQQAKELRQDNLATAKMRVRADLSEQLMLCTEDLCKVASDASEFRSVAKMMLDVSLTDDLSAMVTMFNDTEANIVKVASVPLSFDKVALTTSYIQQILSLRENKEALQEADTVEKVAFLGALIGGVARKIGGGVAGVLGGTAKTVLKHPGKVAGVGLTGISAKSGINSSYKKISGL